MKNRRFWIRMWSLLGCMCSLSSTLLAGPVEDRSTSILITPRRGGLQRGSVGSTATVIDNEQIRASGKRSVAEILRTVPGVEIAQSGDVGRLTSVFLRGAESDQTLILIDGVRVNSGADGAFDLADLRLDLIERIEIVKGPQSVQYGSEAIGGVISIVTRQGEPGLQGQVRLQGGSYNTQDYAVTGSFGNSSGSFSSANSVSYYRTKGISVAAPRLGNTEDDGYENVSLSSNSRLDLAEFGEASLFGRYVRGDAEVDGFEFGVGPVDDLNFTQRRDLFTGGLRFASTQGIVRPSLELGTTYEEIKGIDPDTVFNSYQVRNLSVSPQAHVEIVPVQWSNTHFGYSYEERSTANRGGFDERRGVHSLVGDQRIRIDEGFWLSGGVRHDRYSDFGTQNTFQTTASMQVGQTGFRVHTSFGTGFKAPSFNELYFPNFGNTSLNPEETTGYDAGLNYENSIVSNDLTIFRSEINDLITFSSDTFVAENIGSGRAQGIENEFSARIDESLDVAWTYTYTDSQNVETGRPLPRRPKHRFSATSRFRPSDSLELVAFFLLVNDRIDSDLLPLDDYEKLDLTLRYTSGPAVPFLRLDNVLDSNYEEVRGYGTRGFSVLAGFEFAS
jgi:vitamin B12 transporter